VYTKNDGRAAMRVLEKELMEAVFEIVYCKNDHSDLFMEKIYDKIFELLDKHLVILGGDFNVCLSANESLNRA
jgi:hypothetical protein